MGSEPAGWKSSSWVRRTSTWVRASTKKRCCTTTNTVPAGTTWSRATLPAVVSLDTKMDTKRVMIHGAAVAAEYAWFPLKIARFDPVIATKMADSGPRLNNDILSFPGPCRRFEQEGQFNLGCDRLAVLDLGQESPLTDCLKRGFAKLGEGRLPDY